MTQITAPFRHASCSSLHPLFSLPFKKNIGAGAKSKKSARRAIQIQTVRRISTCSFFLGRPREEKWERGGFSDCGKESRTATRVQQTHLSSLEIAPLPTSSLFPVLRPASTSAVSVAPKCVCNGAGLRPPSHANNVAAGRDHNARCTKKAALSRRQSLQMPRTDRHLRGLARQKEKELFNGRRGKNGQQQPKKHVGNHNRQEREYK